LVAAAVGVLVALAPAARGAEKRISRADLPPAVEKALAEQSKDATVRGLSKEIEGGKTFYEAELSVNGHDRDIVIDESGTVVEVEEEVGLDTLPTAVKEGLRKAAGSGQIVTVASITKRGKLVAYEAVVKTGTKRTEIQVDTAGKRLAKQ